MSSIRPRVAQFQFMFNSADPAHLLRLAEAAGTYDAAVAAIANDFGWNRVDLCSSDRSALRSVIAQRLFDLRPVAQAGGYTWFL